jgi:hypothetical protein
MLIEDGIDSRNDLLNIALLLSNWTYLNQYYPQPFAPDTVNISPPAPGVDTTVHMAH